ncbi:unnamed protein product [Parnassius apollo]|uniref:(apollo) hypothetical protein n=1 Tax=Parnassius apollo TaxID=110799 RepID=A0A8S3WEC2_PARAO|nr:unnamed protein product [Parnassius apollo]
MRVNLSVNLVAMVPVTNHTESVSQVVLDWTPYQRAYVLSGYFWGYLVGNLFGGPLATELWGSRRVIFSTTLFSAILTLLSPAAAKHSFSMMLALRVILGFSGVSPPVRQMLTSIPVLSLCVLSFGTGWGIYFIITAAPNYLANALGFRITATGLLSGVIYLLRSVCNFLFGYLGDITLKKKLVSLRLLRTVACIFSHVIPGMLLLILAIPGFSASVYLTIIMTAMAINGFVTLSSAANGYDLTNNFIAQLGGLVTSLITFAGIISPIVTAYFTKYNEVHVEAWQPVFYVSSFVLVASGLQFIIFGSTEIQPWNEINDFTFNR